MTDPVRARRARWDRAASLGQRTGYVLLLVSIAAFIWGAATGFPSAATTAVAISLGLTTVILAPAIVVGYAVRAAEREDRQAGR